MANMQPGGGTAVPGTEGGDPAALKDANPSDKGKGEGGDQVPTTWEDFFKHPRFRELTQNNQALKDQLSQYEKEQAEAKAKAEAEAEAKLKEANDFKTLAEKNEAKTATAREELKAVKAQNDRYEALAAAQVEAQLKGLSEPITKLLTPLFEGKTAIDKLEILSKQAETIAALMPQGSDGPNKPPRGVPPTPPGDSPEKATEAEKAAYRKTYRQQLKQGL